MWQLLLAEIKYSKTRALLIYFFGAVCFITIWFGVKWEQNRLFMPMLIMIIMAIAVLFLRQKDRMRTGQMRFHSSLPIAIWKIGLMEKIYTIVFWMSILVLYFGIRIIAGLFTVTFLDVPSFTYLGTLTGLFLIIDSWVTLTTNLIQSGQRIPVLIRILWAAIILVALLPFYILTNTFGIFGEDTNIQHIIQQILQSPLLVCGLGLIMYSLDYFLFLKKKSYL